MKTVGDLAAYSIQQDASLRICDARKSALVSILDAMNGPAKKPWWKW